MTTNDPPAEGFARRWSRLKRQPAAEMAPTPTPTPVPVPMPAPESEAEIEIPPPAECIPLEEIAGWMSKRLPDGWREVALRRVWSADLSIRDFVGPADYAWDWNALGGSPGWGPLSAADDIAKLLARAIGEDVPPAEVVKAVAEVEILPELVPEAEILLLAAEPTPQLRVSPEPIAPPLRRRGGRATPV